MSSKSLGCAVWCTRLRISPARVSRLLKLGTTILSFGQITVLVELKMNLIESVGSYYAEPQEMKKPEIRIQITPGRPGSRRDSAIRSVPRAVDVGGPGDVHAPPLIHDWTGNVTALANVSAFGNDRARCRYLARGRTTP